MHKINKVLSLQGSSVVQFQYNTKYKETEPVSQPHNLVCEQSSVSVNDGAFLTQF